MTNIEPFLIETLYQSRVWGSLRFSAGIEPIGEAWGAYEGNRISSGPDRGMTLEEACRLHGADLLGAGSVARSGRRFPILTKLLDTREWLSVQLHPDDEQAASLEGSGQVGKTEAWHLIEAVPGAEIILGLKDAIDIEQFTSAIRTGSTLDVIARQPAQAGDTWFIPAGTVHALGPGIFLYEVQQSSDITYRVYDWNRPASAGRELHIEQAIECVRPSAGQRVPLPAPQAGTPAPLISCPYFTLERLWLPDGCTTRLDTNQLSFQAITCVYGSASISADGGMLAISRFETAIVPAATGQFTVESASDTTLMIASA